MSEKPSGLSRLLQDAFLREEACITGAKPCGSDECAACIYAGRVVDRRLPGGYIPTPKPTTVLALPRELWWRRAFDRIALNFPIQF